MSEVIDARGLSCPQPVLDTLEKIEAMGTGKLEVWWIPMLQRKIFPAQCRARDGLLRPSMKKALANIA